MNSPFGLETKWPMNTFNIAASKDAFEPEHSKIKMYNINPNVALRLGNDTSIAVGADYYKLNDLLFNTQQIDINGSGADWGWNVGLQHVAGSWSFGLAYRSKVSVNVDGTVDATRTGFTRASATSKPEFPDMWQAGARYRVNDRLALEFDYERIGWSSFDKLTITTTAVPFPIVSTNNWQDSDA